ncbi:MAG TPA: hypothetical protein VG184_03575 [Acidimicrobiales bacterium]|nr:hypothetical protein [Acidimicrobiales bacterium]
MTDRVTGIDGYDWGVFGANPVPGDPDAVRAIAVNLRDLADEVAQQNALVRAVGSDSESIWVGPAAQRFRPHVAKLPGELSKLTTSYHDAADALDGYWPRLGDAQALAVQALARAMSAQGAIAVAQGQVAAASAGAESAAGSYNSAAMTAATTPAPTPAAAAAAQAQLQGLQAGYQGAQAQVSAAQANLAAANEDMAAAHHMKDTAVANAHTASAAVAAALHAASAAGIQNPHHSWLSGVFDDIGNVASGAWNWTEHHVAGWAGDAGRDLGAAGEWAWHAVDNPDALKAALDVGGMALGLAAVVAGAGGEVGGGLLDATGVGALVGVPVNVASAALITAGAGMAAVSAADMGHNLAHMAQDADNAERSGPGDSPSGPDYGAGPGGTATTPSDLPEPVQTNYGRFMKSLPTGAEEPTITQLPDGSVRFDANVPAANIPGSYATYTKVVDAEGNTVTFYKTTYAPDGSVVHVKVKYP